jgi:hypothetical protein
VTCGKHRKRLDIRANKPETEFDNCSISVCVFAITVEREILGEYSKTIPAPTALTILFGRTELNKE